MLTPQRKPETTTVIGIGATAVAIVCCAALPTVVALLSGLTLGAILGLGTGAVVLGVLAWTAAGISIRNRPRHDCAERNRHR